MNSACDRKVWQMIIILFNISLSSSLPEPKDVSKHLLATGQSRVIAVANKIEVTVNDVISGWNHLRVGAELVKLSSSALANQEDTCYDDGVGKWHCQLLGSLSDSLM